MSEESTPGVSEDLSPATEGRQQQSSVGAMLAAARQEAGMSVNEVAAQLRLSVRQIRALEEGDAATLPDPTFVRGFIRNYAKLLGLDVETLIAAYSAQLPLAAAQPISLHSENIRISGLDRKSWLPYLLAILFLLVALTVWLILPESQAPVSETVQLSAEDGLVSPEQESISAMQPLPEALPEQSLPAEVSPALPAVTAAPPATESGLASATTPPASGAEPAIAAPVPGGAKLELTYSQEVWLSVLDRDGKEIFNKTKPANSKDVVEGLPPLQLVIGNAAGVSLSYKGKPVDLAPHTKANVARLTLE